ncbi:galactosylceramide sulfotransferase-like [Tachypleus tridentatus]|uniref:galactosylceramide sulfotransferase-like n=1 Tax=Tachypleus tridentatus TaxID=6853 RepID=UPI003FD3CD06
MASFRPQYAIIVILSSALLFWNISLIAWKELHPLNVFISNRRYVSYKRLENPKKCVPKKNIFFLKNHKCGSDTVQNILLRYGDNNNLTFLIPERGTSFWNPVRKPFSKERVKMLPWAIFGDFNIFCVHVRFDPHEIQAVMPPDSVYIAIVREPVSHFESTYSYYNLFKKYGMTLRDFSLMNKTFMFRKNIGFRERNPQLYDFGVNGTYTQDTGFFQREIEKLDGIFDLVMITELMEESLVLLKTLLCWELKDVAFFKKNVRSDTWRENNLSWKEGVGIRAWNFGDDLLYKHFRLKFEKQLSAFGSDKMQREIKQLRQINNQIFLECVSNVEQSLTLPRPLKHVSNKVMGYRLKPGKEKKRICLQVAAVSTSYVSYLKKKHYRWVREKIQKYTNITLPTAEMK